MNPTRYKEHNYHKETAGEREARLADHASSVAARLFRELRGNATSDTASRSECIGGCKYRITIECEGSE